MKRAIALLALALAAAAAQAQELGRLFFTPEQRAALDARRKARVPDNPGSVAAAPVTRVDGFVKRSAGPSTIWINGEWTTESSPEAPRIIEPAPAVSVSAGEAGGGRVRLKPGETLDRGNGEVRDVIGDGEIQVRHRGER
ncbi:MAG TPA: hypothetical protein VFA72_21270 [Burkholderiales bacterium]|nr:hypothetical protein [Burkholderiales bacterium]